MQFRMLATAVTATDKRSLKYVEVCSQTSHMLDNAIC